MQIIKESRIIHHLYSGSLNEKFALYFFYLYSGEVFEGSLTHKRVETNRREVEHNLYQWEYQYSVD